uniref:PDZ domain-containing protein n=1 Tax=Meloidogyne javanica TaxID=6303 RepID=A0A915MFP6_MELJA
MSSSKLKYNSNIITILLQTENYLSENEKEIPMPGIGFGIQGEKPSRLIVIPGGVADRMGLKNDDELLAIDGKTLHGLDHLNIVTKLANKCLQIFPFIFDELNINQNITQTINLNKEQIITISRSQTEQKIIGLVNSLEIEKELNNDFDDSDENCQNTSTESIANSGDLCDPEEIFEGNCSFEEIGFNSPQTTIKSQKTTNSTISNYSQMPPCHRNCHFTPSSHRPIFK